MGKKATNGAEPGGFGLSVILRYLFLRERTRRFTLKCLVAGGVIGLGLALWHDAGEPQWGALIGLIVGAILGKMLDDMRTHWENAFGPGESLDDLLRLFGADKER